MVSLIGGRRELHAPWQVVPFDSNFTNPREMTGVPWPQTWEWQPEIRGRSSGDKRDGSGWLRPLETGQYSEDVDAPRSNDLQRIAHFHLHCPALLLLIL